MFNRMLERGDVPSTIGELIHESAGPTAMKNQLKIQRLQTAIQISVLTAYSESHPPEAVLWADDKDKEQLKNNRVGTHR